MAVLCGVLHCILRGSEMEQCHIPKIGPHLNDSCHEIRKLIGAFLTFMVVIIF
jgi:hypothetical protein